MKKRTKIILVVIIILVIAAICNKDSKPKKAGDGVSVTDTDNKEFNKNDIVNFEGVDYQITKVAKSNGTEFDKPKKGYEYVIVTIKIKNNSDENINYNEFDWKVRNSKGQIDDSCIISLVDTDTQLSSGQLAPKGTKVGSIVFEEPKNDKGLKLQYNGNLLSDEAQFEINLNK